MPERYVNKAFFEGLSDTDLIWHFSSDPNTAKFAFDRLEQHLLAAKLQMARINQAITYANRMMPKEPDLQDETAVKAYFESAKNLYRPIFIEIHFYFVCWVNCENMLKTLCSFPEYIEASRYFNSMRKHFDNYAEARNTFEHYHDRLPAGKHANRVKEIRHDPKAGLSKNFGGLRDGTYTFSNKSWDITPKSYDLLSSIVDTVSKIIVEVASGKRDSLLDEA